MKRILVIGANSKLAKRFIDKHEDKFKIVKFYREDLDLSDDNLENSLLKKLDIQLDGIVFFASIYEKGNGYTSIEEHIKVNALSLYRISRFIIEQDLIVNNGKFIFLTDGGTNTPKKDYLGYSVSKDLLKSFVKNLAVNYVNYIFLGLDLGPVETNKVGEERKKFFSKSLLNVKDPGLGLINFIAFLLQEDNFFSTGAIIDFTGGTYLKRC